MLNLKFADRVEELTTSTGGGLDPITLEGASSSSMSAFKDRFADGDVVPYYLVTDTGDWETYAGTLHAGALPTDPWTLVRDAGGGTFPLTTSTSLTPEGPLTLSAGVKTVAIGLSASMLSDLWFRRRVLSDPTDFYVDTTGSDTADGSVSTPWATVQYAFDFLGTLDIRADVTLHIGAGTFGSNSLGHLLSSGNPTLFIVGDGAGSTTLSLQINNPGVAVDVSALTLSSASANGLFAEGCSVTVSGVDFGACTSGNHVIATAGVSLLLADYSISGGAIRHVSSITASNECLVAGAVTLTGTPAFSSAFVSSSGGIVDLTATFTGSATGKRYDATRGGVILSNGGGSSYLPGDTAGTVATGGQYF